jgi:hypothetical protein
MTLPKIARKFEMTVDELAKYMGYSRQALYSKGCFKDADRKAAAIAKIRALNAQMYQQERKAAANRFRARARALKELEQNLLHGGDSE